MLSLLGLRPAPPSAFALLLLLTTAAQAADTGRKLTRHAPADIAAHVDRVIDAKLEKAKIPASPQSDDAEFLRRVTLDLLGRTPTGKEAAEFLARKDARRREQLVDALLAHPEYGRNFGILWTNRIIPLNGENEREFKLSLFLWLDDAFNRNRPWSQIVSDLLLAEGDVAQTPATGFYLSSANTVEGYVHPDRVAGTVSELFMGVNLRCAQCHDHFFAKWKQTDFWQTAAFFGRVGFVKETGERRLVESKRIIARGTDVSPTRADASILIPGKNKVVKARFLEGAQAQLDPEGPFRPAFVSWLTSPENERFAGAAVNRLWSQFFGRGLVNPVNDMHDDNPATHPEVLQLLTREFIASGHDQQHLIRCITHTQAYQRTSRPLPGNKNDAELYSHAALRQFSGEQIFDSLMMILDGARYDKDVVPGITNPGRAQWLKRFSNVQHDLDPRRYRHGVPQALVMMNCQLTNGGEVPVIRKLLGDKVSRNGCLDALFLEALARYPTADERTRFAAFVGEFNDPMTAYRNVWWVLLNTSEFIFNH